MKLDELTKLSAYDGKGIKMPVLFLGHGSPMNAIEENDEVTFFNDKPVGGSLTMTSVKIATSAF